jgi:hypothetical protein
MSIRRTQDSLQRMWKCVPELQSSPSRYYNMENGYDSEDADSDQRKYAHRPPPRTSSVDCAMKLCVACVCAVLLFAIGFGLFVLVFERVGRRPHHAPPPSRATHPVPAIIQRFRLIKRATAPARGVDHQSVRLAFPHWQQSDEAPIDIDHALEDMTLALSVMSERLYEVSRDDRLAAEIVVKNGDL